MRSVDANGFSHFYIESAKEGSSTQGTVLPGNCSGTERLCV